MSDSQHVTSDRATYSAEHFEPLFAAEERHFWFRSRNRCIAAATTLIPNGSDIRDVLEHGCGTGFVLTQLQRLFPHAKVMGADPFAEGLALARRRFAGPLIQTDLIGAGFREQFDLIGLFDVLEHLDDDVGVLRAIREQLRPGGRLLLTVPAHMALWSDYDIASGHRRRYSRPQLETQLGAAGFKTEYCTGFMFALQPLVYLRRRLHGVLNKGAKKPETANERVRRELLIHPLLNRLLELLLWPEPMWIARGRRLPGGTSILALAIRD
jgi:SAM-dependent methyltransferase